MASPDSTSPPSHTGHCGLGEASDLLCRVRPGGSQRRPSAGRRLAHGSQSLRMSTGVGGASTSSTEKSDPGPDHQGCSLRPPVQARHGPCSGGAPLSCVPRAMSPSVLCLQLHVGCHIPSPENTCRLDPTTHIPLQLTDVELEKETD